MINYMRDLNNLHEQLTEWTPQGPPAFGALLAASVDLLPIDQADLAREFETSRSTVSRWINGHAQPSPFLQKEVAAHLRKLVEKQIDVIHKKAEPVFQQIIGLVNLWRQDNTTIAKNLRGWMSDADSVLAPQVVEACSQIERSTEDCAQQVIALIQVGVVARYAQHGPRADGSP